MSCKLEGSMSISIYWLEAFLKDLKQIGANTYNISFCLAESFDVNFNKLFT